MFYLDSVDFCQSDNKTIFIFITDEIGLQCRAKKESNCNFQVSIAEVFWKYDHEIDPFDLGKICLVFCSDSLYLDSIAITSFLTNK